MGIDIALGWMVGITYVIQRGVGCDVPPFTASASAFGMAFMHVRVLCMRGTVPYLELANCIALLQRHPAPVDWIWLFFP